jgi:hypothetical protein
MNNEGLLKANITPEEFDKLPNTDRMILQSQAFSTQKKLNRHGA